MVGAWGGKGERPRERGREREREREQPPSAVCVHDKPFYPGELYMRVHAVAGTWVAFAWALGQAH